MVGRPETITLRDVIEDWLCGQLGENEIGRVSYNFTTHDI